MVFFSEGVGSLFPPSGARTCSSVCTVQVFVLCQLARAQAGRNSCLRDGTSFGGCRCWLLQRYVLSAHEDGDEADGRKGHEVFRSSWAAGALHCE